MSETIMVSKKVVFLAVALLITAGLVFAATSFLSRFQQDTPVVETFNSLSVQAKALYYQQSEQLTKPVPERLVELDELTIGCFGPSSVLQMSAADTNLGGQCCGALKDAEGYELQVKRLQEFIEENNNIAFIPTDPYDIPVEHAQQLTEFDRDIVLSAEQQNIYDNAIEMSHHGGPCCCKCWKWYVMSGLAKKLIADYDWDEHQIAELWDLSSSCGHSEDTNYQEHYSGNAHH